MKKVCTSLLVTLLPMLILAQTVTVDFTKKKQLIRANGINMEGYHVGPGGEPLAGKFVTMLETLPCQVARFGIPLTEWEPINDNNDPDLINWDGYNDHGWVPNSFNRIKELKNRGVETWLSIWNCANWNISNPGAGSGRRIKSTAEMAESICAYLVWARDHYDSEVKWISLNESLMQDQVDGGWGGYNIASTVADNIALIKKSGELFDLYGIKTKWMIGALSMTGSELRQVKEILSNEEIHKYIAGVDFHAYQVGYGGSESQLKAWGEFFATSDIPTTCGELDNYNFYTDKKGDWLTHGMETGYMYYMVYNFSYNSGAYPWFPESPVERSPYRYVDLQYFAHIPPGYTVVENTVTGDIYAVTASTETDYSMILQNNTSGVRDVEILGFPVVDNLQVIESYYNNYGVSNTKDARYVDGKLHIRMKPYSLYSVGTNLAIIPSLKLGEETPENRIEAEDGTCGNLSVVATGQTGYTGYGYIDFGGINSWAAFDLEMAEAGNYDFTIRNACSTVRPCDFYVNDVLAASYSFPITGSTPTWSNSKVTLPLVQGNNTIKIVATSTKGGPNVDSYTWNIAAGIDKNINHAIHIYPTVVSESIQYELDDDAIASQISLTSLTGEVVKQINITEKNGNVNISDLPAGIYLVKLTNRELQTVGRYKIIKK